MHDAIATLMPIVKREASKLARKLPPSVTLDDLEQAGRVAAWRAVQAFDGRGSLQAFAAQRIQQRLLDYLRKAHPAGRSGKRPVPVSDEEAIGMLPADDDPAAEVQRAQEFEAQMKKFTPASRKAIEAVLAGRPGPGPSAARVSAMLEGKRDRTPAAFDPAAVPLRMGVPVPPVNRKTRNRYRELVDLTPATGSRVLGITQAKSFVSELKKAGIRYVLRTVSPTTIEVWREPSPEQLKGLQCKS